MIGWGGCNGINPFQNLNFVEAKRNLFHLRRQSMVEERYNICDGDSFETRGERFNQPRF